MFNVRPRRRCPDSGGPKTAASASEEIVWDIWKKLQREQHDIKQAGMGAHHRAKRKHSNEERLLGGGPGHCLAACQAQGGREGGWERAIERRGPPHAVAFRVQVHNTWIRVKLVDTGNIHTNQGVTTEQRKQKTAFQISHHKGLKKYWMGLKELKS